MNIGKTVYSTLTVEGLAKMPDVPVTRVYHARAF